MAHPRGLAVCHWAANAAILSSAYPGSSSPCPFSTVSRGNLAASASSLVLKRPLLLQPWIKTRLPTVAQLCGGSAVGTGQADSVSPLADTAAVNSNKAATMVHMLIEAVFGRSCCIYTEEGWGRGKLQGKRWKRAR